MNRLKKVLLTLSLLILGGELMAQTAMQNVLGRERQNLNGKWAVLTDIMDRGVGGRWGAPKENSDPLKLNELYYEGGMTLDVPGDWNSQDPEFVYYEAPMWYKRTFYFDSKKSSDRQFLHFGAVCRKGMVFLNGEKLGEHKGGFTPFQFEVTGKLKDGENFVIVRVDNRRDKDGIPALSFDWWNYGGITRDVDLISTPSTYIKDYWLRLEKGSMEKVVVDVELDGDDKAGKEIKVTIEGSKISKKLRTDENGKAHISFDAKLELWSPDSPKLYNVTFECESDKIEDKIGFRSFEVIGDNIYLNGKPIFLRGINIHEEIAIDRRRSVDSHDAHFLVNEALELGCNFIRLSHYPHNEHMVRLCEENGIMMWEEIPVWQNINFRNSEVCDDATNMLEEMISRDKNRCGIIIWSIANETFTYKERNEFLATLAKHCKELDNTRAVTSALHGMHTTGDDIATMTLNDPLMEQLDIIGVNKYIGWYEKWKVSPDKVRWLLYENKKPVIFSEFGGEAIYANYGDGGNLNSWSEDYMKQTFIDNLAMFENIPNLRGCSPWILFDFRSPRRAHAMYQQGWNRKGLMSPEGNRKQAWYVMKEYYQKKIDMAK